MTENKNYYVTVVHGLCHWGRMNGHVQEIIDTSPVPTKVLPVSGWTGLSSMGDVLYGPYTEAGAERVAKRVLNERDGKQYMFSATGCRYRAGGGSYDLVMVTDHAPYGRQARRNRPAGVK